MSTKSPASGSMACTACPATWTPTALCAALAASSGVRTPCVARSQRRSCPMAGGWRRTGRPARARSPSSGPTCRRAGVMRREAQ
eukprot:12654731-Alexandrium_andersonii.AAC.1